MKTWFSLKRSVWLGSLIVTNALLACGNVDPANNMPYFSVMILADPDSLQAIGKFNLQAGMPAEIYLEGSKQTALQYLMEPITSTVRRAGRQM